MSGEERKLNVRHYNANSEKIVTFSRLDLFAGPVPTPKSATMTRESAGKSMKYPVLSFNKMPAEVRRRTLEMNSMK